MGFADRLEAALKARGFEPLIDRTEIYAFEEWWQRIEVLIARADTVVFVLSPDSVASEVARQEVAFAASLNKRFAPVVLRPRDNKAVPEALAKLNFVFFDDDARFERSADRLAEALDTDIGWIRQHTEFGEQARRWELAKAPNGLLLRSPVLEEAERWIAARPRGAPVPTEETQTFIRRSRQARRGGETFSPAVSPQDWSMALGLAGLAYWQRGIAVEQRGIAQQNEAQAKEERDKATRNFELAQQTAESLVFDIAQGLRDVQGMSAEDGAQNSRDRQGDVRAARGVGAGRSGAAAQPVRDARRIRDTYLTLGELEHALRPIATAWPLLSGSLRPIPATPEWQHDLSVSHNKIGDVLAAQGKLDEALQAYRDGLAIMERLAAADPAIRSGRAICRSVQKVGEVLLAQGKLDEALKAYRDSLAIMERLAAAEPSNTLWQHELAGSYDKIGDVL